MLRCYQNYFCVYRIDINQRYYYGSTKHAEVRRKEHLNRLKSLSHSNKIMQNAYNKYKEFRFTVIAVFCDENSSREFEQKCLDSIGIGTNRLCMNISTDVSKIVSGPLSEKHKRNIGIANKGRVVSEETKKRLSLSHKGKIISPEQKQKQRMSMLGKHKGSNNPMYGTISPKAKPVMLITPNKNSVRFESAHEAAKFIQVPYQTFASWLSGKSKFPGQTKIRINKYAHLSGLTAYYIEE